MIFAKMDFILKAFKFSSGEGSLNELNRNRFSMSIGSREHSTIATRTNLFNQDVFVKGSFYNSTFLHFLNLYIMLNLYLKIIIQVSG